MKKHLFLHVFLLWLVSVNANSNARVEIPSLATPFSLAGNWKFQLGDNAEFSRPDFNDSDWVEISVPKDWNDQGYKGYSGIAWYRLSVNLSESDLQSDSLGLSIGRINDAYEIFVGGKRLGGVGQLPPQPKMDVRQSIYHIQEYLISDAGEIDIAIRVWRHQQPSPAWQGGLFEGFFLIGHARDLERQVNFKSQITSALCAIYIVVGLYHLYLFWRNRSLKGYFWFGCFSISTACYALHANELLPGIPYELQRKIAYSAVYLAAIFIFESLRELMHSRVYRIFFLARWVYLIMALIVIFTQGVDGLIFTWNYFLAITAFFALLVPVWLFTQAIKGVPDSRTLLVAYTIFFGFVLHDVLQDLGYGGPINIATFGFLAIVAGMVISLANRFVETYSNMEIEVAQRTKELSEANSKLTAALEARGQFLANMSHEIRTPMNAIIGLNNLVMRTDLTNQQRSHLQRLQKSAKSLLAIINDILDFSKIDAGKLRMKRQMIGFDEILSDVAIMTSYSLKDSNLELVFFRDPKLPHQVFTDPQLLGQVLVNLASNAIKFTDQGHILVNIREIARTTSEVKVQFEVCDTGIGMSSEQLKRVFKPFEQADASTSREYGGTGLGLAISDKIVKDMGGQIAVESTKGQGSIFHFSISFEFEELASSSFCPSATKPKILLLESTDVAREICLTYLESFNFPVTAAADLNQVSDLDSYDLVLIDEKSTSINQLSEHQAAPEIIVMGKESSAQLLKPVTPTALLNAIGQATKTSDDETSSTVIPFKPLFIGKRILVVDDAEVNLLVAGDMLEAMGLQVEFASSGQQAIEKASRDPYDCILMDLQMPVMDGITASKKIRELDNCQNVPIIAMTASVLAEDVENARRAGMNCYVAKPVEPDHLFEILKDWIKS